MQRSQWRVVAVVCALASLGACLGSQQDSATVQGWTPDDQGRWYEATQGSRLMPLSWMKALEQADSNQPFLADANLTRFGLLPRTMTGGLRLPVGFAVDDNEDTELSVSKLRWVKDQGPRERWIGFNCSACHTAELHYQDKQLRIDGGPSLFDFQSFIEALDASLVATRDQAEKWDRFARAVLGARDGEENRSKLREALSQLIAWEQRVEAINKTPLRYGHGRVDAFGHIFNKVALFSGAESPTPNPADAPVSYPFLWDIYRHDRLQWNGIAENSRLPLGGDRYLDYGALGRNSGEVIGVFGDVVVRPGHALKGYQSSIQADNLIRLETQLSRLRAPAWPADVFGAYDAAKVERGRALFVSHCKDCHEPRPGTEPYPVKLVPLVPNNRNNTDPWMACNAISYTTATGRLEGTPKAYFGNGERFGREAPNADMLSTTVKGAMVGKKWKIVGETARMVFGAGGVPRVVVPEGPLAPDARALRLDQCFQSGSKFMAYKARPLDGIWATAPYLHNGSVPTLYDLLRPLALRPKSFLVGTRQYDPVRVGYVTGAVPGNVFRFETRDASGADRPGNSNAGHDYGAERMSEEDRWALVEYMKTL